MYDSDVGFGFGGRGIGKNYFDRDESFDLMVFVSTKGEQAYQVAFSIPDPEIRQGTSYPKSLDLELEFSKILKSNFFGFGNESEDNEWQFPRETALLSATVGRAFTRDLIGEFATAYRYVTAYDYEESEVMADGIPGAGEILTASVCAGLRWDTRERQIHPDQGWIVGCRFKFSDPALGSDFTFQRYRLELSRYVSVFSSTHVLAGRLWLQHVEGRAPYYEQSIVGGGSTARGLKADRFVDSTMSLASLEYRLMISYPVSTVLFFDAGRVYPAIQDMTLRNWHANIGSGLRYHLEGFIVRFDAGFSDEGARIFLNFGHVF
jgi:outer membrane protein assembly factor BamA